jgi:N-acetylglutamate synthase-like GNAT family acetyltransferase
MLSDAGFNTMIIKKDPDFFAAVSQKGKIYSQGYSDTLLIRTEQSEQSERIRLFLDDNSDLRTQFIAELHHEKAEKTLSDLGIRVISHTWSQVTDIRQDELTPHTFYRFTKQRKLIGKASIDYFNGEMGEYAPSIDMFEILPQFRGHGTGKRLLQLIEDDAQAAGFDRIWATEVVSSFDFWKKAGYDIDIDEGLKCLD